MPAIAAPARGNFPRRGEMWLVDLEPIVGHEIGRRRPSLVVSNDTNNQYAGTVTILPVTSAPSKRVYPDEVVIPRGVASLSRRSRIKANMIRTVDKSRLIRPLGTLPGHYVGPVNGAIAINLNMR